jgi:hypothetical protein
MPRDVRVTVEKATTEKLPLKEESLLTPEKTLKEISA